MALPSEWTNSGLRSLIDSVNKLRDCLGTMQLIGSEFKLDLPQIAVVGGQSAGKSSVLENFVGREFLPRGSGIVTRRPLILQLINTTNQDYGEFGHARGKRFSNFEEIRREIERETDRCVGSRKAISAQPIHLSIYSKHVLNLTLIDLPGLTKVPVGDQPGNIEKQIRDMILGFIRQPNCLILAVTPANQDLATSDALKLAKEVDPEGRRTVGVLTKLDLMDEGTNARQILLNKVFPLSRGYVGVVCRSQRDIDESRCDIMKSLSRERKFFERHPAYADLAHKCGTSFLQETLNRQLCEHIRDTLPGIRDRLQQQLAQLERRKSELTLGTTNNSNSLVNRARLLIQLMAKFSNLFEHNLFGSSQVIIVDRLATGARLNRIYHELFPLELHKPARSEREILQEVTNVVRNTGGIRTGISSDAAFEMLVKKRIEQFREPIFGCIQLVSRQLGLLVDECIQQCLATRPLLAQKTAAILRSQLNEQEQKTMKQMSIYVDIQLAYMNMYHEDLADLIAKSSIAEIILSDQLASQPAQTSTAPPAKKGWFIFGGGGGGSSSNNSNQATTQATSTKQPAPTSSNLQLSSSFGSMKNLSSSPKWSTTPTDNLSSLLSEGKLAQSSLTLNTLDDSLAASPMSQALEIRILNVRRLVDAYLQIVRKTVIDLLIKTCNHFLVSGMNHFICYELQSEITDLSSISSCADNFSYHSSDDQWSIMDESEESRNVTESIMRQYEAHKRALDLLNDIDLFDLKQTQRQPRNSMGFESHETAISLANSPPNNSSIPPLPPRTHGDFSNQRPIGFLQPENQTIQFSGNIGSDSRSIDANSLI